MTDDKENKNNKTKITIEIIGALALVCAAVVGSPILVEMYKDSKNQPQTQVPTPIVTVVSTDTDTVNTPSISPTSNSISPTSIWTPSAEYPGADWKRNCISSDIWDVYSANYDFENKVQDGCYQLLEYGISAHSGNLAFVREKVRSTEIYGILVPIPDNVEIEFVLRVNKINNADIWMGIVKEPNSRAGTYLVSKKDAYFDIIEIRNTFPSKLHENYHIQFNQGNYHFRFELQGNQWNIWRDGTPQPMFTNINLTFTPRYLFIGYRAYPTDGVSGELDVRISDLMIEEQ